MRGTVVSEQTSSSDDGLFLLVDEKLPVMLPNGTGLIPGERASIYVRAGALSLVDGLSADALANVWRVPLEMQTFHGDYTVLLARFGGMRLRVRSDVFFEAPPDHLYLHIDPSDIMVFRDDRI